MKLSFLGSKYPKTEYIQWKAKLLQFKHLNDQIISELYSFLGMVTYLSDFIPHLATLLDPLLGSKYPKTEYIQWKAKLLQFKHLNHQIISVT